MTDLQRDPLTDKIIGCAIEVRTMIVEFTSPRCA